MSRRSRGDPYSSTFSQFYTSRYSHNILFLGSKSPSLQVLAWVGLSSAEWPLYMAFHSLAAHYPPLIRLMHAGNVTKNSTFFSLGPESAITVVCRHGLHLHDLVDVIVILLRISLLSCLLRLSGSHATHRIWKRLWSSPRLWILHRVAQ